VYVEYWLKIAMFWVFRELAGLPCVSHHDVLPHSTLRQVIGDLWQGKDLLKQSNSAKPSTTDQISRESIQGLSQPQNHGEIYPGPTQVEISVDAVDIALTLKICRNVVRLTSSSNPQACLCSRICDRKATVFAHLVE
jgi:hypothetical protein